MKTIPTVYIPTNQKYTSKHFIKSFLNFIDKLYIRNKYKDIIVLNIGTDSATGDCLAPIVGYKLGGKNTVELYDNLFIYGNFKNCQKLS